MSEQAAAVAGGNRDLVVNPGEYIYMQDTTKGAIKTNTGPIVINQTGQEQPVVFENGKFRKVQALEQAVKQSPRAKEGDYLVLSNPAVGGQVHPEDANVGNLPDLNHGCKVNIPGPTTFSLWPGQEAKVIPGHHLRSNQFLLVSVYNEEEAAKNWDQAVVKAIIPSESSKVDGEDGEEDEEKEQHETAVTAKADQLDLTMGKRYVIKGTEVSFYIPPTGVEVIPDENDVYVREAVTLERLEIAILVDEDGNKRYEKGPQVVFPTPTEEFFMDENGKRKFKAVELNQIQGIHVKVIAPYTDDKGKDRKEGEEFFVTGKDCAIFYPRPELQIVQYGDRMKHYAVAVPAGEGRYVMNRDSGVIKTEGGPKMLLPNPVDNVIVRRVLSDKQVNLWYPSNQEALDFNRTLRQVSEQSGDMSQGYLTDAVYTSSLRSRSMAPDVFDDDMDAREQAIPGGFKRGVKFTKPRELTLDTKYDGVPVVCPWTGYAVLVVSKTGKREVRVGPETILLGYDEELEVLSLSTGKPKNTDDLMQTVYLRVKNNKVSDVVHVHTSDHVAVDVKLSFRVDFDGEPEKWFEVENYVKFLCDHVRSMLKGIVRKIDIEDFYGDGVAIVRDIILGKSVPIPEDITDGDDEQDGEVKMHRTGLCFEENGMRVVDVEVLDISIKDTRVREMLEDAQFDAVSGNVRLAQSEKALKISTREDEIDRLETQSKAKTQEANMRLEAARVDQESGVRAARQKASLQEALKDKEVQEAKEDVTDLAAGADLLRRTKESNFELASYEKEQVLRLEELEKDAELTVKRFGCMKDGMTEALLTLSNRETMTKIAQALSAQQLIGGNSVVDVLGKVFKGTTLEGLMTKVMAMSGKGDMAALLAAVTPDSDDDERDC